MDEYLLYARICDIHATRLASVSLAVVGYLNMHKALPSIYA